VNGKWFVGAMLGFTAVFGAALWYNTNYAYYRKINDVSEVSMQGQVFAVRDYRGIDADTSPLKMRACFNIDRPYEPLGPKAAQANPLIAPMWFTCFDAEQIAADIDGGKAISIRAGVNEPFGFTRYVAQYPNERAFMWRQINECGDAKFSGEELPPGCSDKTSRADPVVSTPTPKPRPQIQVAVTQPPAIAKKPADLVQDRDVIRLLPLIGQGPEPITTGPVLVESSASDPLAFHGCFTMEQSFGLLTETFETAEPTMPLPIKGGLSCFDAEQLAEDLNIGYAVAFWGERDIAPGVDRVVAVYDDGRAFVWHQKNQKYAE